MGWNVLSPRAHVHKEDLRGRWGQTECCRDEVIFHGAVLEQETADGVHQRNVAAGCDRDVERGVTGGFVRRGSTTISSAPGFALMWALTRSKVTWRCDQIAARARPRGEALRLESRRSGQARHSA